MSTPAHLILYSHDTFGLGHIRRNRKIARSLVEAFPELHASIITGSGLSGEYASHPRISYIEIDQVEKLPTGQYRSANPEKTFSQAIDARKKAISDFVRSNPADVFIADKEPLGLGGELTDALAHLKAAGTTLVLGLRDVLDEAETLKKEWENKGIFDAIDGLYDHIWIYGSADFYNPLKGIGLPQSVLGRCSYTGYLYQPHPEFEKVPVAGLPSDYILVTAGGGGDGDFLMNAVLGAYESDQAIPCPAVLLLGPYTDREREKEIRARADNIGNIRVIGFNSEPEALIRHSKAVIGMCGYNTFCEVIARDKRVLFVPRQTPRMEQLIRAERAQELGLCETIRAKDATNPTGFAKSIRALIASANQPAPIHDLDSSGLQRICDKVGAILDAQNRPALEVERAG
ncbi:glycosyltransferase family protein [Hoeflea sp. TYP-13]|uniref:glycosyltransferase family protein n=1 Tax=Hoeflea sp. TYP-13 TaxID=3230023 RepID=UPI0034C5FD8F